MQAIAIQVAYKSYGAQNYHKNIDICPGLVTSCLLHMNNESDMLQQDGL